MTDMPFDMSFSDYLKQEYGDERWDKAKVVALSYVQGFNAANADKIGIKGLAIQESAEEELGETQFRIISGYDTIIDAMVRKLPRARILLQNVVKEIDWNSEGVRVSVIDRVEKRSYQLSCKSALVTLPLGVLKAPETSESHVRFTPPLDDKSKAMQSLEMGPVARNTFRFTNRFWESLKVPGGDEETDMMKLGFLHDNELPVPTWWTQMPVRVPLLVGWVAGASFERQFMNVESEEIAAQALKSLSMLLNIGRADLEKHLVESYTHNWQTDPFALGAYSYVGTNGLAAQKRLAEPVGNALFFAGEATNSDGNWGTVHGAIDSGVRAAKEILKVFHGN
jgi:monoamine oxidase